MRKGKGYWTYERCREEAQKYDYKSDFKKYSASASVIAIRNGWMKDYDWFLDGMKRASENRIKWTYDACKKEAEKYKTLNEFLTNNRNAYMAAYNNGWLDTYTWFEKKRKNWDYETCYKEALKYKSRQEFSKNCGYGYELAREMGWLDDYTWFSQSKTGKKWTYETCYQEALKYKSKSEFHKNKNGAYHVALKNGWLDDYTWMIQLENPYHNNMDNVYAYFFTESNSVYVGRTIDIKRRDWEHRNIKTDTVLKFANTNNVEIPEITIIETGLSLENGRDKEDYYKNKYKAEGWNVLNKGKTGKTCGSIGKLGGKWTKKSCLEEAQKYKTIGEFHKKSVSAYQKALKMGWINDYTWLESKIMPSNYWTYERCFDAAMDCKTKVEFRSKYPTAYTKANRKKWMEDYTWFVRPTVYNKNKPTKWTYENCLEISKTCKTRNELFKKNRGAHKAAYKNGWLDEFFPKAA